MALVTLPNLYCSPNDVWDLLGEEATSLRLDDHSLATGQTIKATANAALGATSISIQALQFPLLIGTILNFDGGGMSSPPGVVQAQLTGVGKVGDVSLTVLALPAQINATAQAQDSGVNLVTAQRLVKGCQYGTTEVKKWCCPRYDDSQLATSWSVNRWATACGAQWLCRRRGQKPPPGVRQEAEAALEELKWVRSGFINVEDIGTRTSAWPFWSNMTMDRGFDYTVARVEPQLSEGTPTKYAQYVDWGSVFLVEW